MWLEIASMQAALNKRLEEQTGVVQIQRGSGMVAPIRPDPPADPFLYFMHGQPSYPQVGHHNMTTENSQLLRNQQLGNDAQTANYYKKIANHWRSCTKDKKQTPQIKHEPLTEGIEVTTESNLLQEITVADGYMRIKHTYFFRPKWWQFWKAPSVTKKAWYASTGYDSTARFDWCTEDGNGVDSSTKLWLHDIAEAYFGRKRAEKAAAKLREVDAKMESPEIAELDPSSPTYNPLKKLRKERVSE